MKAIKMKTKEEIEQKLNLLYREVKAEYRKISNLAAENSNFSFINQHMINLINQCDLLEWVLEPNPKIVTRRIDPWQMFRPINPAEEILKKDDK